MLVACAVVLQNHPELEERSHDLKPCCLFDLHIPGQSLARTWGGGLRAHVDFKMASVL